jgi:hypothetical protein
MESPLQTSRIERVLRVEKGVAMLEWKARVLMLVVSFAVFMEQGGPNTFNWNW